MDMDQFQRALQQQNSPDANQNQFQDSNSAIPLTESRLAKHIKPIISSKDVWTISANSQYSLKRLLKCSPKSYRNIAIKQRDDLQVITVDDMKKISRILKKHKCIRTMGLKISGSKSPPLKIFAQKLRTLTHLKSIAFELTWYTLNSGTKALISFPKHLKKLTNLRLRFKYENWSLPNGDSNEFNSGIKYFKFLTTMHFDISNTENIRAQDLGIFLAHLRKCRYLKDLTLNLDSCQYMPNKAVHGLAYVLQSLRTLSKINLNFKRCHKLNHKAAYSLASSLNSLQKLSSLTLNFDECQRIDSNSISILSNGLSKHSHLKALDFTFPYYENVSEGMDAFLKELVHVQPLTSLKLCIPSSQVIIREDLAKNLSQALQAQSQLKVLNIKLKHAELEGSWTQYLAEGFSALQNLSKLFFTFKYSKSLNDKTAEDFGEALSKLKNLSTLKLHLNDNFFGQEGIRKVFEGIAALNNLKEMDLNLDNRKSTGFLLQQVKTFIPFFKSSEIKSLNSALNGIQNNLKVLRLDLILFNSAAQDLSLFSENLASMKQLSTLHLQLNKVNSSETLQKGLEDIFSGLKNIQKLTDLALTVHNGLDQDLQSFLISLKDCRKIEALFVCFPKENTFTMKTAYQFIEAMERLEKLYKLGLNICFETNLAQEVSLFLTGIKRLKSLSSLQLSLGKVEIDLPQHFLGLLRSLKTIIFDHQSFGYFRSLKD